MMKDSEHEDTRSQLDLDPVRDLKHRKRKFSDTGVVALRGTGSVVLWASRHSTGTRP